MQLLYNVLIRKLRLSSVVETVKRYIVFAEGYPKVTLSIVRGKAKFLSSQTSKCITELVISIRWVATKDANLEISCVTTYIFLQLTASYNLRL